MEKDATTTVLSKFAKAIELCPNPVLSEKLAKAMTAYTQGGHELAESEVEAILAEVLASGIPGFGD